MVKYNYSIKDNIMNMDIIIKNFKGNHITYIDLDIHNNSNKIIVKVDKDLH